MGRNNCGNTNELKHKITIVTIINNYYIYDLFSSHIKGEGKAIACQVSAKYFSISTAQFLASKDNRINNSKYSSTCTVHQ